MVGIPEGGRPTHVMLSNLRKAGWMVAVHNDYRLDGKPHTFWLFTHSNGLWVKGEGKTDEIALSNVLAEIETRHAIEWRVEHCEKLLNETIAGFADSKEPIAFGIVSNLIQGHSYLQSAVRVLDDTKKS